MNENQVTIFTNEEFGDVRTIMINDKPYFCGKDIAEALGYAKPRNAIATHCKGALKQGVITKERGVQEMTFIPEGDIYRLIIRSKLPSAEKFESWVFDEVLPQIRKTGGYIPVKEDDDDSVIMARALLIAQKTIEEKDKQLKEEREQKKKLEVMNAAKDQVIGELQPKADYTDTILKSNSSMNISQIAKDYGMSAKAMNSLLHDLGVQYKSNGQWLLYSNLHDKGYTKSETGTYDNGNQTYVHTKWTQKGRLFLYELLKKNDVLPIIEQ